MLAIIKRNVILVMGNIVIAKDGCSSMAWNKWQV